jgi:hypothetical protein
MVAPVRGPDTLAPRAPRRPSPHRGCGSPRAISQDIRVEDEAAPLRLTGVDEVPSCTGNPRHQEVATGEQDWGCKRADELAGLMDMSPADSERSRCLPQARLLAPPAPRSAPVTRGHRSATATATSHGGHGRPGEEHPPGLPEVSIGGGTATAKSLATTESAPAHMARLGVIWVNLRRVNTRWPGLLSRRVARSVLRPGRLPSGALWVQRIRAAGRGRTQTTRPRHALRDPFGSDRRPTRTVTGGHSREQRPQPCGAPPGARQAARPRRQRHPTEDGVPRRGGDASCALAAGLRP